MKLFKQHSPWIFGGIAILVGIGALGLIWHQYRSHHITTKDAYLDGNQLSLSADVSGRLIQLLVDEGDFVQKGTLLALMDESLLEKEKAEEVANVVFLEKQLELQKILLNKQQDLYFVAAKEYEKEILSFLDFDQIEKNYLAERARLEMQEAALAQGIASLKKTEELLCCHTKLYAPSRGEIAKRWVVAGDVLKAGQPIFSLTEPDLWVMANFEETKIQHIKPGDLVAISVDAYPNLKLRGSVKSILSSAASRFSLIPPNNATGNFTKVVQRLPVKITLESTPKALHLYPGMSVNVTIEIP